MKEKNIPQIDICKNCNCLVVKNPLFNSKNVKYYYFVSPNPIVVIKKDKKKLCYGLVAYNIKTDNCTDEVYMEVAEFKKNPEKELNKVKKILQQMINKNKI